MKSSLSLIFAFFGPLDLKLFFFVQQSAAPVVGELRVEVALFSQLSQVASLDGDI